MTTGSLMLVETVEDYRCHHRNDSYNYKTCTNRPTIIFAEALARFIV
jgi:hypothetical protein